MANFSNPTLAEFLRTSPHTRSLWGRLGVDIARCGDCSLADVCRKHDLDPYTVVRMLEALGDEDASRRAVILELLPLDELCDHIEARQHAALHKELAKLDRLTRRVAADPGGRRAQKIRAAFLAFRTTFTAHLREEAGHLLPSLRRPPKDGKSHGRGTLRSHLARLAREHRQADDTLAELGLLAEDWKSHEPESSAARRIVTAVSRLHSAVHEQIYTENRLLFPQAQALSRHRDIPA